MKDREYMRSAIAGAIGAFAGETRTTPWSCSATGRLCRSAGAPSVLELAEANVTMLRTLTGHRPDDD